METNQNNTFNGNIQIIKQLDDLKNVDRLISNTLNLIADIEIKGAYAGPVKEIQDWLTAFKGQIANQVTTLQALLPKEEVKLEEAKETTPV